MGLMFLFFFIITIDLDLLEFTWEYFVIQLRLENVSKNVRDFAE